MRYQVVARRVAPAGAWEYYPYWAPTSDKEAALRLARYAAQTGYEAAILQSRTTDALQEIGRSVVDGQVSHYLPAVRFSPDTLPEVPPGAQTTTTSAKRELGAQLTTSAPGAFDGPTFTVSQDWLDRRRVALEDGPGGDLLAQPGWQARPISLPLRMDVLVRWLSLRGRMLSGVLGGPLDGDAGTANRRRDD